MVALSQNMLHHLTVSSHAIVEILTLSLSMTATIMHCLILVTWSLMRRARIYLVIYLMWSHLHYMTGDLIG